MVWSRAICLLVFLLVAGICLAPAAPAGEMLLAKQRCEQVRKLVKICEKVVEKVCQGTVCRYINRLKCRMEPRMQTVCIAVRG